MFGRRPNQTEATPTPADMVEANSTGGQELESLWEPSQVRQKKAIEQILLERGHVTEEQLDQARKVQSQTPGKSIVQVLQTMNAASEPQILSALAETLDIPFETPHKADIDPEAYKLIHTDYVKKNLVLPIRFEGAENKTLVLGMADPNNVFLFDEIRRKTKRDTIAGCIW